MVGFANKTGVSDEAYVQFFDICNKYVFTSLSSALITWINDEYII